MAESDNTKELWIVGELVKSMPIRISGMDGGVMKMVWHEGMIGVCPVFDTYTHARAYAERQEETTGVSREVWPIEQV